MNELLDDLRLFFIRMRLKSYFYNPSNKNNANRQPTMDNMFMSQTQSQQPCSEEDRTQNKFTPKSAFDPKIKMIPS